MTPITDENLYMPLGDEMIHTVRDGYVPAKVCREIEEKMNRMTALAIGGDENTSFYWKDHAIALEKQLKELRESNSNAGAVSPATENERGTK